MSASDAELRETLRSAKAWIAEFHEEGVDAFEPQREALSAPVAGAPAADLPVSETASAAPAAGEEPAPAPAAPGPPATAVATANTDALTLDAVREDLGECTRCPLHETRTKIVFGDGNPHADLMFVGEGPGQQEDETGLPFVGRAGELLTKMIEAGLEIPRSDVYICNIVKCRPPGNRNPLPNEVAACRGFLDAQIRAVQPKVIIALGKPATSLLLGREVAITRVRGQWHEYEGTPVMPTFHPAFVLRQYTAENRRAVWQDLKAALAKAQS